MVTEFASNYSFPKIFQIYEILGANAPRHFFTFLFVDSGKLFFHMIVTNWSDMTRTHKNNTQKTSKTK